MPQEPSFSEQQEANLVSHIFSVSAGMVGVCLTVISLLNVVVVCLFVAYSCSSVPG